MRAALWPEESEGELASEIDCFFSDPATATSFLSAVFIGEDRTGAAAGFIELFVRNYAEGCSGAVPHIEGWYVNPESRGQGLGRALMHTAEEWAREHGFRELASDTTISNEPGQRAHQKLGFQEVERSVHFRKSLDTERR
ncbi:MAG: aminoglycoside 6-N-acetyltransferase [Thermoanaerobaculia bacterium]|nr:aminoglycoside 6-N-acetyltransferase [Thermoanaerobaculia bacterium]